MSQNNDFQTVDITSPLALFVIDAKRYADQVELETPNPFLNLERLEAEHPAYDLQNEAVWVVAFIRFVHNAFSMNNGRIEA